MYVVRLVPGLYTLPVYFIALTHGDALDVFCMQGSSLLEETGEGHIVSPADGIGTFLKPALPPRLTYHTPMRSYHLFLMTRVAAARLDFSLRPYGLRSK
jgi:hypothetical protein